MFQAEVNEDASGDVTALQQEIRKLKVLTSKPHFLHMHMTVILKTFHIFKQIQLSSLMKNQDSCGALSDCIASPKEVRYYGTCEVAGETNQDKCHCQVHNSQRENIICNKFVDILRL